VSRSWDRTFHQYVPAGRGELGDQEVSSARKTSRSTRFSSKKAPSTVVSGPSAM